MRRATHLLEIFTPHTISHFQTYRTNDEVIVHSTVLHLPSGMYTIALKINLWDSTLYITWKFNDRFERNLSQKLTPSVQEQANRDILTVFQYLASAILHMVKKHRSNIDVIIFQAETADTKKVHLYFKLGQRIARTLFGEFHHERGAYGTDTFLVKLPQFSKE